MRFAVKLKHDNRYIHRVQEKSVYDLLTELLRHPPRTMHLVSISRRDVNLPIASLRAKSLVTEIRLNDLRFTLQETASYLKIALGDLIDEATAATITEKAEGWVTGLRLAVLAMRGHDDAVGKLLELKGTTAFVMDYLITEVLNAQPSIIRHYLLSTSILDRFTAALCDAVFGPDSGRGESEIDGADFIAKLQSENLFLIALDTENGWFRYHHLFQDLLRNQLKRRYSSEEIATLQSQASAWFEGMGLIDEALKHALLSDDVERAAQIVERHRQDAVNADQWYFLDKWLALIPETTVQQHAELLMARAWVLLHYFRFETVLPLVDQVEAMIVDDPAQESVLGEIELCRGYSLFFLGEGDDSLNHLVRALQWIPVSYYEARAQTEVIFALSSQMVGQKEHAIRSLDDLLAHYDSPEELRKTRLLITYVFIHFISGNLVEAEMSNRRLWKVVEHNKYVYVWAWTTHMQGLIHLHRCEWEAAVEHLGRSVEQRFIHFHRAAVDSITGLMLAYQALGQEDDVRATMQVLQDYVASFDDPTLWGLVSSAEARLAIMQGGQPEIVSRWLETGALPPEGAMLWWLDLPSVTRCRALIAEGASASLGKAEKLLDKSAEINEAHHNTYQLIGIRALQAMACARQNKTGEALTFLNLALSLARPGDFLFQFLELGSPMKDLLLQLQGRNNSSEFIGKLLAAFGDVEAIPPLPDLRSTNNKRRFESETVAQIPNPKSTRLSSSQAKIQNSLIEPLTHRELDVLELLAQRLQNKEIADKLFVSTETVKAHLHNIYQKLSVSKRREAVEKAKKLRIF